MKLFKTEGQTKEINLTKIRGNFRVEMEEHKGKHGGEYYTLNVLFENGTKIIIDMQLVELLCSKLHSYIRNKDNKFKNSGMNLMDDLIELISGNEVRDAILESIYD